MATGHLAGLMIATVLAAGSGGGHGPAAKTGGTLKEITVTARRWQFEPNVIEVTRGDHVRLVVQSADGTHGFVCKKLGIRQVIPRGGEEVVVEFDATRSGRFSIRCSEYCGVGHSRMAAVVVVRDATPRP